MTASSIETRYSWIAVSISVVLMAMSFGALWIVAVGLKSVAADLGGARSAPSLASSFAWIGTSVGGLVMGRLADRYGTRWTVAFGAVSICIGLYISTLGAPWQLYLGHGVFMGLFGNAGFNAPLYVYVSRWFDRRRGSALALISSGGYLAGTIWPPLFERAIALFGWRETMMGFGLITVVVAVPLALVFLKPPPETAGLATSGEHGPTPKVFGWPPNLVFAMLASAAFLCCVTMSMPQAHLVALCSDLGISPRTGAAMLSLLLGAGLVARQVWGAISDRIGGLSTLLIASVLQAIAMAGFVVTQDETGLFAVSGAFGAGFGALIPAYVLAIRQYYPAHEAGWRVPALLLLSGSGMAAGTWLAGALYDHFGYYAPAFAAGVATNLLNIVLIGMLVTRRHFANSAAPVARAA